MMLLANKHQPPKRDFKLETLEIPKYSAGWFHVTIFHESNRHESQEFFLVAVILFNLIHVDLKASTFTNVLGYIYKL